MRLPATLALALALTACKGDPPTKPAQPVETSRATAPIAPIHIAHDGTAPEDPPPPTTDDGAATPTPRPPPQIALPMAQDPAALKKQLVRMDAVIERTQQALDQATDEPSRHKAGALLTAMRRRRDALAVRIGVPPSTAPAPAPSAPAP